MYGWTRKSIEKILIQLDDIGLPFKKYTFKRQEGSLKILGSGQSAYVYEATDRKNGTKEYAIKVIGFTHKHIDSEEFTKTIELQKFMSEMESHIVRVYDFKEIRVHIKNEDEVVMDDTKSENYIDLQFIVMEKLTPVISFDKQLRPRLYPEKLAVCATREVYKLATNIGNALMQSHQKKLLHRDIKLENIFYDNRKKIYKLGDFGIAKLTNDGMAETRAFTKGYGAPEVVEGNGEKYDETADIYSLGMVLYVILNGLKFPGSNSYSPNIKEQYSNGYLLNKPQNTDAGLFAIVEKMCRFNPDDRQQLAKQVVDELDSLFINSQIYIRRQYANIPRTMAILFFMGGIVTAITEQKRWIVILCFYLFLYIYSEYAVTNNRDGIKGVPFISNIFICILQLAVMGMSVIHGKIIGGKWIFSSEELICFGIYGGTFYVLWLIRIIIMRIKLANPPLSHEFPNNQNQSNQ